MPPTAAPPTAPTPPPAQNPLPPSGFSGAWSGSSSDSQGDTTIAWSLTEDGRAIGGTVKTHAVNPDDGSCNSCHRNKSGTVTGTVVGDTLTLTMYFAAGVDGDPTPACSATLTGSATMLAEGRISGRYTGSDTCEGSFTNGALVMTRQPSTLARRRQ